MCCTHYGQDRGLNPYLPKKEAGTAGKTYGVVIAISDYATYRKLDYAHRDGQAFADWLSSPGGEITDKNNLKVLIDKDASFSAVVNAFDWLNSKTKDGDRVFIYFAGHGDVESKSANEPGYLLCYDSPLRLFAGGGAIPLNYLQEVITTLSMKNARVVVVLDACHAGKLAGDVVQGRQRAAENMVYYVPDPNVIKILSCKADQNSREEAGLGGGRGVFSYFLVNGLAGLADVNKNNKVTVSELERYLEDNVLAITSPVIQEPLIKHSGSKTDVITQVDPFVRDSLLHEHENRINVLAMMKPRTLTGDLTGRDTIAMRDYQKFKECLKQKRFFEPKNDCAEHYFNKILKLDVSDEFKFELTRNYSVALQEKSQLVINNFVNGKVEEISKSSVDQLKEYKVLPQYLDRAANLLGEEHYFYKNLKSNQYLFEGLLLQLEYQNLFNNQIIEQNIALYKKSLSYNPNNPLSLYYLSTFYAVKKHNRDSCDYYYKHLVDVSTTWVMAYAQHAYDLSRYFKDYEAAKKVALEGWAIDSSNTYLIKSLGSIYFYQKDFKNAILKMNDAVKRDSTDAMTWVNLGTCYAYTGNDTEATESFEKAIKMDSNLVIAYLNYGGFYLLKKDYKNAEKVYLKLTGLRPDYVPAMGKLCMVYLAQNDLAKVQKLVGEIKKVNPEDWRYYLYSACLSAKKGKDDEALALLRKAFEQDGFDDLETVEDTDYFNRLKQDGRLDKLINEIFND